MKISVERKKVFILDVLYSHYVMLCSMFTYFCVVVVVVLFVCLFVLTLWRVFSQPSWLHTEQLTFSGSVQTPPRARLKRFKLPRLNLPRSLSVLAVTLAPPMAWRHGESVGTCGEGGRETETETVSQSVRVKAALIAGGQRRKKIKPAMASLRQEQRYGLSSRGRSRSSANSTLYHVKLTDTALRALEAHRNLKVPSRRLPPARWAV